MNVKKRKIPDELLLLRYLKKRMDLSEEDHFHLSNMEKGFAGELQWDTFLDQNLISNYLIMNDLLLQNSGQHFQIDSLLLLNKFKIFEIKNYDGEYYVENNRWYTLSKTEIQSPLNQLQRTETAFRRFLKELGINIPVEAYVVFIHPEFTLYHAPINPSIILPTQLHRLMKKMNSEIVKIPDHNRKIAEKVISHHIDKSPFTKIPSYNFDSLQKSVFCKACSSFVEPHLNHNDLVCKTCHCKEHIDKVILRNIEEYRVLFPERKLTTREIFSWCGGKIGSFKKIHRILKSKYEQKGTNRHTYFI